MTEMQKRKHYFVAFERFQLFLAFCSSKQLEMDQITTIRQPGSSRGLTPGTVIHILDEPSQDVRVELDVAKFGGQCVLEYVCPFDKPANKERRRG